MRQPYRRNDSKTVGRPHPPEASALVPGRQGRPRSAAVPPKDTPRAASIVRTLAFRFLVAIVGAENLALALDASLTRIDELKNGEKFTSETAYHMETTLDLPDGFFDQTHPVLAPETLARLKSPLEFWGRGTDEAQEDVDRSVVADRQKRVPAPLEERSVMKFEMSGNKHGGAARTPAGGGAIDAVGQQSGGDKTVSRGGAKGNLQKSERKALAEIRRLNLQALTVRQGAKAQLGRLLEMSQSNMAHRLHGQKRMDDLEAQRVTDRLGLPVGWLDVPREPSDVPEAVSALLTRRSRREAVQPHVDQATLRGKSRKANTGNALLTGGVPVLTDTLPPAAVGLPDRALEMPPEQVVKGDQSAGLPQHGETALAPKSGRSEDFDSACATSLEALWGIAPIAEALLKTLAGKARTGRLNEDRALHLLQQIVLL